MWFKILQPLKIPSIPIRTFAGSQITKQLDGSKRVVFGKGNKFAQKYGLSEYEISVDKNGNKRFRGIFVADKGKKSTEIHSPIMLKFVRNLFQENFDKKQVVKWISAQNSFSTFEKI